MYKKAIPIIIFGLILISNAYGFHAQQGSGYFNGAYPPNPNMYADQMNGAPSYGYPPQNYPSYSNYPTYPGYLGNGAGYGYALPNYPNYPGYQGYQGYQGYPAPGVGVGVGSGYGYPVPGYQNYPTYQGFGAGYGYPAPVYPNMPPTASQGSNTPSAVQDPSLDTDLFPIPIPKMESLKIDLSTLQDLVGGKMPTLLDDIPDDLLD